MVSYQQGLSISSETGKLTRISKKLIKLRCQVQVSIQQGPSGKLETGK